MMQRSRTFDNKSTKDQLTCEVLREELQHFAEGKLRKEVEDAYIRVRKGFRDDMIDVLEDHRRAYSSDPSADERALSMQSLATEETPSVLHLTGYSEVKELKKIEEHEKEIGVLRSRKASCPTILKSPPPELDGALADPKEMRGLRTPSPTPHANLEEKYLNRPFESDAQQSSPCSVLLNLPDARDQQNVDKKQCMDEVSSLSGSEVSGLPGAPLGDGFSQVVPAPTVEPAMMEADSSQALNQVVFSNDVTDMSQRVDEQFRKLDSTAMAHSTKHLAKFATFATRAFEEGEEESKGFKGRVYNKVHHPQFDYLVGLLILINAFSIGVQTDYAARHREQESLPVVFRVIEIVFCILFAVELSMRLIADCERWFTMPGWQWNIFDSFVLLAQFAEEILNVVAWILSDGDEDGRQGSIPNFSFMRVLRILRLIRIIRLVRILRFIGELRTLVTSILSSLKSLVWTVILLSLIIYSVSVYLTQVVVDGNQHSSLDKFYGNLLISMLTLFQSVTGGLDWNDALRPLVDEIHPLLALVLGLYIAFTVLAVMNVVTGVFVESALLSASYDHTMYMVTNMRELFLQANDGDPHGSMAWDQFASLLDTSHMQEFFKAIDVDLSFQAARSVFQLLDVDKSGSVELDEFVTGCSRLRGQARALDLNVLLFEMREMSAQMRKRFHEERKDLSKLQRHLRCLERGSSPDNSHIEALESPNSRQQF